MKKVFLALILISWGSIHSHAQSQPTCQITGIIYDLQGQATSGIRLVITPLATPGAPLSNSAIVVVSGPGGAVNFSLIQGAVVRIEGRALGYSQAGGDIRQVPQSPTGTLEDMQRKSLFFNQGIQIKVGGVLIPNYFGTLDFVSGASINQSPAGEANITLTPGNFDAISDVTITSPSPGQYPRFNGSQWVNSAIQASDLPASIDAAKIGGGAVSNTEFNFLDGVNAKIQDQLNAKASVAHFHTIADTTGLQAALDSKQPAHAIGNLTVGANLTVTGGTGALIGTGALVSLSPSVTVQGNAFTGDGNLVKSNNPVFSGAPTLPDFTNAQHNHQSPSGGGSLDAAAIGSGTIADARLSSNVSKLGPSIDLSTNEATGFLAPERFPALSGDVSNTPGSLNISLSNVVPAGTCTNCDLTVDIKGRVTAFSNGTGGGGSQLTGSKTYDPPSLDNGEAINTTVTLTGANPGDVVQASFSVVMPAGVYIGSAAVIAADTVLVTFVNESGQSEDIGSGTLKVSTLTPNTFLTVLTPYDPPSLENGEAVIIDITVNGAQIGDVCSGSFAATLPDGVFLSTPQVISSNTVRHTIVNNSGLVVDLSQSNLRTSIWR